VSVIPLRIGSGTRMKILEGGAMGKAMVSTSVGAEGLDFVPGKEILIADTPQQFAASIVELLRDPVRRRRLGEAARQRVGANYDLRTLESAIEIALNTLKSPSAIPVTIGNS
jgi:glycosyltransferase involved in cell wall biosynthesis